MIKVVIVEGPLHAVAVALRDADSVFFNPIDGLEYKPLLIEGSEPPVYVGLIETMRGPHLDAWVSSRIARALRIHQRAWQQ